MACQQWVPALTPNVAGANRLLPEETDMAKPCLFTLLCLLMCCVEKNSVTMLQLAGTFHQRSIACNAMFVHGTLFSAVT